MSVRPHRKWFSVTDEGFGFLLFFPTICFLGLRAARPPSAGGHEVRGACEREVRKRDAWINKESERERENIYREKEDGDERVRGREGGSERGRKE